MKASEVGLAVLVAAERALGASQGDPWLPGRSLFTHGPGSALPADDEQLVVTFTGIRPGQPGSPLPPDEFGAGMSGVLLFELWAWRAVVVADDIGTAPIEAEATLDGVRLSDMAVVLWTAIGQTLSELGACRGFFIRGVEAPTRTGGLGSLRVPFEVTL